MSAVVMEENIGKCGFAILPLEREELRLGSMRAVQKRLPFGRFFRIWKLRIVNGRLTTKHEIKGIWLC